MGNPRRRKIRKHMVGRAFAKRSASGSFAENISNFVKENAFSTEAKNGVRSDMDNIMLRELYGEGGVNGGDVLNEGGRGANLDNTTFFHGQVMDLTKTPLIIDNGIVGGVPGVYKTTDNLDLHSGSACGMYIISSDRLLTADVGASSYRASACAVRIDTSTEGRLELLAAERLNQLADSMPCVADGPGWFGSG